MKKIEIKNELNDYVRYLERTKANPSDEFDRGWCSAMDFALAEINYIREKI